MGNVYITAYGLKVQTFARRQKHTHTHMALNLFVLVVVISVQYSHICLLPSRYGGSIPSIICCMLTALSRATGTAY